MESKSLSTNKIFKIISLFINIENVSLDLEWEKYRILFSQQNDINVCLLSDAENIHGLQFYRMNDDSKHIVRRNYDVMIVDDIWKNRSEELV